MTENKKKKLTIIGIVLLVAILAGLVVVHLLDVAGVIEPFPTPANRPTSTSGPTGSSTPTNRPTNTSAPTATPEPTETPMPTSTPEPTATPEPTSTPTPTPEPVFTFTEVEVNMRTVGVANVRKGPNLDYEPIMVLEKETYIVVDGICVESGWYRFTLNGVTGYIGPSLVEEVAADEVPLHFKDSAVENKLKQLLGISTGSLCLKLLADIEEFDATECGIKQVSDLVYLPNLKTLTLAWNELTSLEGLEKLTNLESLDLSNNYIKDISVLKNIPLLKTVDLSYNYIADISALSGLELLEKLDISYNIVENIWVLENNEMLAEFLYEGNRLPEEDSEVTPNKGMVPEDASGNENGGGEASGDENQGGEASGE